MEKTRSNGCTLYHERFYTDIRNTLGKMRLVTEITSPGTESPLLVVFMMPLERVQGNLGFPLPQKVRPADLKSLPTWTLTESRLEKVWKKMMIIRTFTFQVTVHGLKCMKGAGCLAEFGHLMQLKSTREERRDRKIIFLS